MFQLGQKWLLHLISTSYGLTSHAETNEKPNTCRFLGNYFAFFHWDKMVRLKTAQFQIPSTFNENRLNSGDLKPNLSMTTIREEISMADSVIHSKKTIIFIAAICVNNIDKVCIRFINSYFFTSKFKRRTSWIQSSDSIKADTGFHELCSSVIITVCLSVVHGPWNSDLKLNSDFAYLAAYEQTWLPRECPAHSKFDGLSKF